MKRLLALLPVVFLVLTAPGVGGAGAASEQFTLSSNFVGLYPNADLQMQVSVKNLASYPITVRAATVVVGDANPQCLAANVIAHSYSGDVVVPAGGTATIPVRMQMLASAPNPCQGATFPLTFIAQGEPGGASNPSSGSTGTGGFAFTGLGRGTQLLAAVGASAIVIGLVLVGRRRETTNADAR